MTLSCLDFNCFTFGLASAVPSNSLLLFTSKNTTLDRVMTTTEASLMASLTCLGGFLSTPLTGFLLDYLGRKKCIMLASLMGVISWALLVFTNKVATVLVADFILGFTGSVFLIVPVYVGELSQNSIRGTLASGTVVFNGVGALTTFVLGEFLEYKTITYIGLTLATLALVLLSFLKESPTLLMKKGLEDEAAKAMAFYRNSKPDSKVVVQEIDNIRRALAPEAQEMTPEEQKLVAEFGKTSAEKPSMWKFFKKSRSTQRALFLTLTIMAGAILQGFMTIQMYAIQLFSEAVPREVLSPNWCSALFLALSVGVGLVAGYLTDVTGRRTLLIYSGISAGICAATLGSQIQFHWGPQWSTALFIYLFCITYTFGSGTVPFLLMAELFLPEVRGIMSMICVEWNWVITFLSLFAFNPLVSALGLGAVFYFFSSVAFGTAAFAFFCLPETNGLTVDAIQRLLVKKKDEKA
ncbi:hypothetical protein ABMA28_009521 [Loxostege sticticalis]|uniref:Major facilitator superfamily (MFS) profile domain-containing protein n=1 Tax=Loxostege sticticalis TaxID=481309 RepID=A0ABD0SDP4_LOXSC